MERQTEVRRTARGPLEVLLGIAGAAALTLGVSACGRARSEKPAEPKAADARQDEGTAPTPDATPANPAVAKSGWAIASSQNTEKDMQAAEAAVKESLAIQELPRLKAGLISAVRRYLQYPDSAVFRGEHLNVAHTALCGEVDYEQWKDGASGRSGFRAFVATPEGIGAVDTDFPGMHERYLDAAARIDCTPDLSY